MGITQRSSSWDAGEPILASKLNLYNVDIANIINALNDSSNGLSILQTPAAINDINSTIDALRGNDNDTTIEQIADDISGLKEKIETTYLTSQSDNINEKKQTGIYAWRGNTQPSGDFPYEIPNTGSGLLLVYEGAKNGNYKQIHQILFIPTRKLTFYRVMSYINEEWSEWAPLSDMGQRPIPIPDPLPEGVNQNCDGDLNLITETGFYTWLSGMHEPMNAPDFLTRRRLGFLINFKTQKTDSNGNTSVTYYIWYQIAFNYYGEIAYRAKYSTGSAPEWNDANDWIYYGREESDNLWENGDITISSSEGKSYTTIDLNKYLLPGTYLLSAQITREDEEDTESIVNSSIAFSSKNISNTNYSNYVGDAMGNTNKRAYLQPNTSQPFTTVLFITKEAKSVRIYSFETADGNVGSTWTNISIKEYNEEKLTSVETEDVLTHIDRAPEITSMLESKGYCELDSGDFYVSKIIMPENSTLKGQGASTRIFQLDDYAAGIVDMNTNCKVNDIYFLGQKEELTIQEIYEPIPIDDMENPENYRPVDLPGTPRARPEGLWNDIYSRYTSNQSAPQTIIDGSNKTLKINGNVVISAQTVNNQKIPILTAGNYYFWVDEVTRTPSGDTSKWTMRFYNKAGTRINSNSISLNTLSTSFTLSEDVYKIIIYARSTIANSTNFELLIKNMTCIKTPYKCGIKWEGTYDINQIAPKRGIINNCRFSNFKGPAIYLSNTGTPTSNNVLISNCFMDHNYAGIYSNYSEFINVVNCTAIFNGYGFLTRSGNLKLSNSGFDRNWINIQIDTDKGSNWAHGMITNCSLHHAGDYIVGTEEGNNTDEGHPYNRKGYALIIRDTRDLNDSTKMVGNMSISNCFMGYGHVMLKHTQKNALSNCKFLSAASFYVWGSLNYIKDCIFKDDIPLIIKGDPKFDNCYYSNGIMVRRNTTGSDIEDIIDYSHMLTKNGEYYTITEQDDQEILTKISNSTYYGSYKLSCKPRETFCIFNCVQNNKTPYIFTTSDDKVISYGDFIPSNSENTLFHQHAKPLELVAPPNAAYLYVNHYFYQKSDNEPIEDLGWTPKIIKLSNSDIINQMAYKTHQIPYYIKPEWKHYVVATYKNYIVIFKDGKLQRSADCGLRFNKIRTVPSTITEDGPINSYHLFSNGALSFSTEHKMYYIDSSWNPIQESTCLDIDGTTSYDASNKNRNFYQLREMEERKFLNNGKDMHVFGNYPTDSSADADPVIWYSIDYGQTYKIAYKFNQQNTLKAKHTHFVYYYEEDDAFIVGTGDNAASDKKECHVFLLRYNETTGWSAEADMKQKIADEEVQSYNNQTIPENWYVYKNHSYKSPEENEVVKASEYEYFTNQSYSDSGSNYNGTNRSYKWSALCVFNDYLYFTQDSTPGKVMRCKYYEINEPEKWETLLSEQPTDTVCIAMNGKGEMIVIQSGSRSTNKKYIPIAKGEPLGVITRKIYYSPDRKTFYPIYVDPQILERATALSGTLPITSDGHVICGAHRLGDSTNWNRTPSVYLDEYIRLAGFNDAFKPI